MGIAKWIGAAIGWAVAGPIGAIIGFLIGMGTEGNTPRITSGGRGSGGSYTGGYQRTRYTQQEQRNSFMISLLVLSAAVMKADGKVLKSELNFVKRFISNNFGEDAVSPALSILKQLLEKNYDITDVCLQIKQNMVYAQRLQLLDYLAGIAKADGVVVTFEHNLLRQIASLLGIKANDYNSIFEMHAEDADPYKILEISSSATDEEVRKAYRKLAVKFHPDKVEALGDNVRKAAEEKFKKIQAAYEQIKKERGMK